MCACRGQDTLDLRRPPAYDMSQFMCLEYGEGFGKMNNMHGLWENRNVITSACGKPG